MGLDNIVNEGDESANSTSSKPGSSKKYVKILRDEFEEFLYDQSPYYWQEVNTDSGELVYETDEFMIMYPDISLRIFSTIDKGTDEGREKGDDAIRTVIWSKEKDVPIGGRKSTYRIKTWKKNLLRKIKSLSDEWHDYVEECPNCDGWLVERQGNKSSFLGCINWEKDGSGCDYTRPLEHEGQCPECEDGFLVKREGRDGKFLGCSNWKSDGSGCSYTDQINE